MSVRAFVPLVCGIVLAPAAFADYYVTSRDGGVGDLYRYSDAGTFLAKLQGNGLINGQGVTIGPNGNLFVSNEAGNVLQYNAATGAFISVFVTGVTGGPLIFGPDNNLYVGSGMVVKKFNGTTGAFIGNFATGLFSVHGLAFGPNGNLFVSDLSNTIKQFDGTTGAFVNNFATSPLLNFSAGALLFYAGNLLVSQTVGAGPPTFGNSILKFDQTNGNSLGTFASDANLNGPAGLLNGPDGNLYVVNFVSNNVVRYSPAGAFLGVFANTGANGAQASRFITFASVSGGGGPTTPAPSSLILLLVGIAAISGWLGWRRIANRHVHLGA